ncbi:hypothetical protein [Sciscionella marina]|uniref:hypothetical protein n=1 Tax=Sciscionella marina TaxID=508770 RepID=UPI0012F6E773|nr:hypothetical protein [Sciscionella marina]
MSSHRPHLDGVRDQNGNTIWAWYNGIDSLPVPAAETIVDWSPATWRTFRTRIEAYLATALDNADTTSLGWPAFNENATRYLATHVPSPAFPNDGGVIDAPGADPRLVPVSELIPGDVFCYEHAGTHYKITAPTWPVPGDGDGVIWVFVAEQPWPLTLPASQLVQATYRPREIAIRCLLCGNTTRAWVNTAYLSGGRGICRRCDRGTKA